MSIQHKSYLKRNGIHFSLWGAMLIGITACQKALSLEMRYSANKYADTVPISTKQNIPLKSWKYRVSKSSDMRQVPYLNYHYNSDYLKDQKLHTLLADQNQRLEQQVVKAWQRMYRLEEELYMEKQELKRIKKRQNKARTKERLLHRHKLINLHNWFMWQLFPTRKEKDREKSIQDVRKWDEAYITAGQTYRQVKRAARASSKAFHRKKKIQEAMSETHQSMDQLIAHRLESGEYEYFLQFHSPLEPIREAA